MCSWVSERAAYAFAQYTDEIINSKRTTSRQHRGTPAPAALLPLLDDLRLEGAVTVACHRPKLSDAMFAVLEAELDKGPIAHGWPDQRWTHDVAGHLPDAVTPWLESWSGGRKNFPWVEYRDRLVAAHQQLGGPIVLIWDNLNVHKDRRMRAFIDTRDWITAYHLPPCTPNLNPVEGIWSILGRTSQANTAFTDPDHLIQRLRHGLRQLQYRSDAIDGYRRTGSPLPEPAP
ncbi:transposase [Streptomyces albidochromogenes]|uniref:Transposase n=1 Tax=Streptomyces albidochromogenes TaxID=329524 RepID=A0ABW6FHA4_9ACTN